MNPYRLPLVPILQDFGQWRDSKALFWADFAVLLEAEVGQPMWLKNDMLLVLSEAEMPSAFAKFASNSLLRASPFEEDTSNIAIALLWGGSKSHIATSPDDKDLRMALPPEAHESCSLLWPEHYTTTRGPITETDRDRRSKCLQDSSQTFIFQQPRLPADLSKLRPAKG